MRRTIIAAVLAAVFGALGWWLKGIADDHFINVPNLTIQVQSISRKIAPNSTVNLLYFDDFEVLGRGLIKLLVDRAPASGGWLGALEPTGMTGMYGVPEGAAEVHYEDLDTLYEASDISPENVKKSTEFVNKRLKLLRDALERFKHNEPANPEQAAYQQKLPELIQSCEKQIDVLTNLREKREAAQKKISALKDECMTKTLRDVYSVQIVFTNSGKRAISISGTALLRYKGSDYIAQLFIADKTPSVQIAPNESKRVEYVTEETRKLSGQPAEQRKSLNQDWGGTGKFFVAFLDSDGKNHFSDDGYFAERTVDDVVDKLTQPTLARR